MDFPECVMKVLRKTPAPWRHAAKCAYEGLPGYGRKVFYGNYGEDAFLQSYYRQKTQLSQTNEMMMSVILRRRTSPGFYIDIGAHHPTLYSNTYWFYRRGWRGINIDAAPGSMRAFCRVRPRDVNLELLISDEERELDFVQFSADGSVNTVTTENATYFASFLGAEPTHTMIKGTRLESVLSEHVPAGQTIDFMTVDVEGHDLNVLRSNDWDRFRPEMVLVEDHRFATTDSEAQPTFSFMRSMGYELYAWIRPTVVFRLVGLRDWLVPACFQEPT